MQNFYSSALCIELSLHRQSTESSRRAVAEVILLEVEAGKNNPGLRKQPIAGVPDEVHNLLGKRDTAIDVVMLLPESRRLPPNFVNGGHLHTAERLLLLGRTIDVQFAENDQRQCTDAVIGFDHLR